MTTIRDGYEAGVDAVIADNTISRGEFVDAVQTVITSGLSNAEGNAWVDALAVEYNRLGQHNNPTYNSHRGFIISSGKTLAMDLFDAFNRNITGLPESVPVVDAAQLTLLRDERDNVDAAIDRMDVLIANEPGGTVGRLVKEELRIGKQRLKNRKQAIRDAIQAITGDPDS
jgi:hypothetical protein